MALISMTMRSDICYKIILHVALRWLYSFCVDIQRFVTRDDKQRVLLQTE